jgi:T-complex protein 1 subunit theta
MSLNAAGGSMGLLKDGYQSFSGVQEAVLKNTEAIRAFSEILRTSMGPNGMNKMVINHLDKLFVTSDAATIVGELEVQHPAAKMVMMASKQQQAEFGDGTGFIVAFAGELMAKAEDLIKMGIPPADIVKGYRQAIEHVQEVLPELVCDEVTDMWSKEELVKAIKPVIASKQYGYEDVLSPLVADACLIVMPSKAAVEAGRPLDLNMDSIRLGKMMGGNITDCSVLRGMVVQRKSLTNVTHKENAKIAIFNCPVEAAATEAKSTVLISNAEELVNYNKSEEKMMEANIKAIAESGADVVISGGSVSEMAVHFIQKYGMMAFKIPSKWEHRRLCRALGATACTALGTVQPEEMGHCDFVETKQLGGRSVTVFRQESESGKVASIILRSATKNVLDDLERTVNDGINTVKTLCKDRRLLPGAGATDIALAQRLKKYGNTKTGLEQYAIRKFGEALEVCPRTLGENGGQDYAELLSGLYSAHAAGNANVGVDIENDGVIDSKKAGIFDAFAVKENALTMAADAVITVLRVDQIIMSKQAGGPKKGR